jgi:hypothetical protein
VLQSYPSRLPARWCLAVSRDAAHDPEMRYCRKTNARRFAGYELHVAADAQAPW